MTWFKGITTVDEAKKAYHKLAMQHHPDKGGNTEIMQEINNEYHKLLKSFDGETFNNQEYEYDIQREQHVIEVIAYLLRFNVNIEVEIIGTWVWVRGNTYAIKDQLKDNQDFKFFYSKAHKCWYYNGDTLKVRKKSRLSIDEIREKHGNEFVKELERQLAS